MNEMTNKELEETGAKPLSEFEIEVKKAILNKGTEYIAKSAAKIILQNSSCHEMTEHNLKRMYKKLFHNDADKSYYDDLILQLDKFLQNNNE